MHTHRSFTERPLNGVMKWHQEIPPFDLRTSPIEMRISSKLGVEFLIFRSWNPYFTDSDIGVYFDLQ